MLKGIGTAVKDAVPGNDTLTVGISTVSDKVTLPVGRGSPLGPADARVLECTNRSSPEFENSGPVLPLAVGKTALELADSGESVTEGWSAVTKGCSPPPLEDAVRFAGIGGTPAEGCSTPPLAVRKIALEFAVNSGTEAEGCATLPLAVGRTRVRLTERGGMTTEGCSVLPLAVGRSKVRFAVSAGMITEGCSTLPLAVGNTALEFADTGATVAEADATLTASDDDLTP